MTSQALNRPVDLIGVLDAAGANPYAEEGSPAWELARLSAAVTELVGALDLYAAVCGNTCAMVPRDVAADMYDKSRAALAAIEVRP